MYMFFSHIYVVTKWEWRKEPWKNVNISVNLPGRHHRKTNDQTLASDDWQTRETRRSGSRLTRICINASLHRKESMPRESFSWIVSATQPICTCQGLNTTVKLLSSTLETQFSRTATGDDPGVVSLLYFQAQCMQVLSMDCNLNAVEKLGRIYTTRLTAQ